jgi:hypothetical protein
MKIKYVVGLLCITVTLFAEAQQKKKVIKGAVTNPAPANLSAPPAGSPNILVIWGDDIGTWNISHNNRGMMGYRTPNIDRIAKEGVSFTDYYAQQSCTAGRAAFISGSVPVRSGMTKVGLPGAKEGWQKSDVTMATVLKGQGYAAKKAWVAYYAFMRQFADVGYNYSITAHRSQGSTYSNTFVMEGDIRANPNIFERNRILYTAYTRAAQRLFVVK